MEFNITAALHLKTNILEVSTLIFQTLFHSPPWKRMHYSLYS